MRIMRPVAEARRLQKAEAKSTVNDTVSEKSSPSKGTLIAVMAKNR